MKQLSVRDANSEFLTLPSSGDRLDEGIYVLAVRLSKGYLEAAIVPVIMIEIGSAGDASYLVNEGEVHVVPDACPEQMMGSPSCRHPFEAGDATK